MARPQKVSDAQILDETIRLHLETGSIPGVSDVQKIIGGGTERISSVLQIYKAGMSNGGAEVSRAPGEGPSPHLAALERIYESLRDHALEGVLEQQKQIEASSELQIAQANDRANSAIKEAENRVATAQGRAQALAEQLNESAQALSGANSRIEQLNAEKSGLHAQLGQLRDAAHMQTQSISELESQVESSTAALEKTRAALKAAEQTAIEKEAQATAHKAAAMETEATASNLKAEIKRLEGRLEEASMNYEKLSTRCTTLNQQRDALQTKLNDLQRNSIFRRKTARGYR